MDIPVKAAAFTAFTFTKGAFSETSVPNECQSLKRHRGRGCLALKTQSFLFLCYWLWLVEDTGHMKENNPVMSILNDLEVEVIL